MLDGLKIAGRAPEYIVAVPGRRFAEFAEMLAPAQAQSKAAVSEVIGKLAWAGSRSSFATVKRRWPR